MTNLIHDLVESFEKSKDIDKELLNHAPPIWRGLREKYLSSKASP